MKIAGPVITMVLIALCIVGAAMLMDRNTPSDADRCVANTITWAGLKKCDEVADCDLSSKQRVKMYDSKKASYIYCGRAEAKQLFDSMMEAPTDKDVQPEEPEAEHDT